MKHLTILKCNKIYRSAFFPTDILPYSPRVYARLAAEELTLELEGAKSAQVLLQAAIAAEKAEIIAAAAAQASRLAQR